jgi:hypothetical protein
MPRLIQPSFAKGELSPSLYGRVDTAAYQVGLRKARNLIIHTYGGASYRNGLHYLEPVADHTYSPRLIPFQFKTTDQYILEFGDFYMRVIRADGHVLDTSESEVIVGITQGNPAVVTTSQPHDYSNGDEVLITSVNGMTSLNCKRFTLANVTANTFELTDQVTGNNINTTGEPAYDSGGLVELIYEIVTPYSKDDLFEITYVQNADTMTLCHKSYPVQELTRTDHDAWTLTEASFGPELDDPTNVVVTVDGTPGAVVDRYRVTATNSETGEESLAGINSTSKAITGATQANPVVITSASHGFIAGDEVELDTFVDGMTELNGRRFTVANPNAGDYQLEGEDGTGHSAYSSGGQATSTWTEVTTSAVTKDNTITWNAVTGADRYTVYRRDNGVYGFLGDTELLTFKDNDIAPALAISPPAGRNPFDQDNNPGAVTFYEQRRVFGGSTSNPDTSWFSQIGRFDNFNISNPVQTDDAITAKLAAREVNEIRQYMPGNDLTVFTSGSEWRVNGGPDTSLAPDTIQQKPQTNWGSSFRPPILIGDTTLFVTDQGHSVRSFGYSLQIDGYTGSNLLLLAEHLVENDTIKDWSRTRDPETRIHVVMNKGNVICLTFDQEQEVIAWSTWDTDGEFESTASLQGSPGDLSEDSVYFVVKRTINGVVRRNIEVWRQEFFESVEDAFFVDSGLTYDSPVAITAITLANPAVITAAGHGLVVDDEVDFSNIVWVDTVDASFNETQPEQFNGGRFFVNSVDGDTFTVKDEDDIPIDSTGWNAYIENGNVRKAVSCLSGLEHLEGKMLSILMDGNVETSLTVSNGQVTLPRCSTRVHLGLRYIGDLETLNIESPQGTTQGQKKKISDVVIRFKRSRGLLIGPSSDKLREMKQREFEPLGEPTELLTGDKKINIPPDWNSNGRLFLRQKEPLPFTILAVAPQIEPGDEE